MRRALAVAFCLSAPLAQAHSDGSVHPDKLWSAWAFSPGIVLPLLASAALFVRGVRGESLRQRICFWLGWATLTMALVSPLHEAGEALFSVHMIQHEVLILAAAPLLVLGHPLVPMLRGLPMQWRKALGLWSKHARVRSLWASITRPWAAWWLHGVALWTWHAPGLFQATLTNDWLHALQHVSFLGTALLFWWSMFVAEGRLHYGAGVLYVFTTGVHTSILGALLTFARTVWYPAYSSTSAAWGVSALEDQQLGGLIMWVPAGIVYLGIGLAMFGLWLREVDVDAEGTHYAH